METDRFRKRLSLLGVAVGIYSIVTALSLVDCLQASVQEGFAAYGGEATSCSSTANPSSPI